MSLSVHSGSLPGRVLPGTAIALAALIATFGPLDTPRALATGAVAVSAGSWHTCAITTEGGVKCWGANEFGQLGDGSTNARSTPVDVSGRASDVTAISAGQWHTCAVTGGGGVKCWGSNSSGQLGNGTTDGPEQCTISAFGCSTVPIDVSGLADGIAAVSTGTDFTCALTNGGSVKCWGNNAYGQLGDGQACGDVCATPTDVPGLSDRVAAISTDSGHACALTSESGVKCWGANGAGALGDGTTTQRSTPVDVVGLASGAEAVAAGSGYTCALTAGGGAKCWGTDYVGNLGDGYSEEPGACGDDDPCLTPVDVSGIAGAAAISAGGHACVLLSAGGLMCWGMNGFAQLGGGSNELCEHAPGYYVPCSRTPVPFYGSKALASVATGWTHTCLLTLAAGIQCWGNNTSGQVGDGTTDTPMSCLLIRPVCFGVPKDVIGLSPMIGQGDVNCDGTVSPIDATLVLQFSGGLVTSLPCPGVADLNQNHSFDSVDAALILQHSAGLIDIQQ